MYPVSCAGAWYFQHHLWITEGRLPSLSGFGDSPIKHWGSEEDSALTSTLGMLHDTLSTAAVEMQLEVWSWSAESAQLPWSAAAPGATRTF